MASTDVSRTAPDRAGRAARTPALELPIGTPRLVIRDFGAMDLDAIREYATDAGVLRHLLYEPRDAAELVRHLARLDRQQRREPRRAWELAIEHRRSGRVIGAIDLALAPPRRGGRRAEADLGYLLARRHWGHGYAAEAAGALVDAAFRALGLARIRAFVEVRNDRSRRVLEKAGFVWNGLHLRHAHAKGRWWDCHVYALDREDWQASRRSARARA